MRNITLDTLPKHLLVGVALQIASSAYSAPFFTPQQRESIAKAFNEIVTSNKKCTSFPRKKIALAASGMDITPEDKIRPVTKTELCAHIHQAHENGQTPIVHEDSLTAWGNIAAERYGLSVGDILALKKGDSFKVILMDRNVGDYLHGTPIGTTIDPRVQGFTYALYTHQQGLSGQLKMNDDVVLEDFTWEINIAALSAKSRLFWGPIPKNTALSSLDSRIKVGWRGPAIRDADAAKMPATVIHYDTWWNDYVPFRVHNYLKRPSQTAKHLQQQPNPAADDRD